VVTPVVRDLTDSELWHDVLADAWQATDGDLMVFCLGLTLHLELDLREDTATSKGDFPEHL
jgi:hypothetical protein